MREPETSVTIRRTDYQPPAFLIDHTELNFHVDAAETRVRAQLDLRRVGPDDAPLQLAGRDLGLLSIAIDGEPLSEDRYRIGAEHLSIDDVPDQFRLETECILHPDQNTALEGLYCSGNFLLTQCEAEGFRHITYYLDRPDVMATYRVRMEADRERYPVLLSNGNCSESGDAGDGRHFAVWDDPFPKPSYLFALVAGDLECLEDRFTTAQGREVTLRVYVESENMDKVDHAMVSLKKSMQWDESRFGLSYDLDVYNIVATNDFNMGAMENKSLNIFNSKFVLARPDTATDADYQAIEGVIGHEYFHNWTGNRVTCRDWFQLSLKEGLTVFRDQEFSSDMQSRAVKRIEDVRSLRSLQFAEDAGPMAHPVRPESYIEINNFYTLTVYEKGAEVVRMMHTLLGEAGFQRGMRLYFERHDGQAVTCDDFRQAMADANQVDLTQFERWYAQAGTPRVDVRGDHDPQAQTWTLTFRQHTPPTPGQDEKLPLHMPVRIGLIDDAGNDLPLRPDADLIGDGDVLELTEAEQRVVFHGIDAPPVPSLFRGFSAPVIVDYPYTREQLAFLMSHDSDSFNRWDASQRLATAVIMELADRPGGKRAVPDILLDAAAQTLDDRDADPALIAEALRLPDEGYLAEQSTPVNVDGLHSARREVQKAIAGHCLDLLLQRREELLSGAVYSTDPDSIARRSLANLCLAYLVSGGSETSHALALEQYQQADNMTDSLAALMTLVHNGAGAADGCMQDFRDRWKDDALVMDKWLMVLATNPQSGTLARVEAAMDDPVFSIRNPNKVRSLFGTFSRLNPVNFHAVDGSGYGFMADQVLAVDRLNPQVAARLVGCFNPWRRYDEQRRGLMQTELERIVGDAQLSRDVGEIAGKALQ
jgi:aminopeptidase N